MIIYYLNDNFHVFFIGTYPIIKFIKNYHSFYIIIINLIFFFIFRISSRVLNLQINIFKYIIFLFKLIILILIKKYI